MGKKKVKAPVYKTLEDTEYIKGLRNSLADYKLAADTAYNKLASMDDADRMTKYTMIINIKTNHCTHILLF